MPPSLHDGQSFDLPPELIRYIRALNEPIEKYSPYFDALFIKRRNHSAFFQDLKDFRSQDHISALLTSNSPGHDVKELYRKCSRLFLQSRFAHPWCRTTPSQEGWFKAEWGTIKRQSEAKCREEDKLHKLLVPIWCGFRVRMMPTKEQMEKFLEREKKIERAIPVQLGVTDSVEKWLDDTESEKQTVDDTVKDAECPVMVGGGPTCFNTEALVSEEDDRVHEHTDTGDGETAAAAAKLFIGAAATTFLAKNARARKYLFKKLKK